MKIRRSEQYRKTQETEIKIILDLDNPSPSKIHTGLGFFDHMLEQLAKHGQLGLEIIATGDTHIDYHHLVEDTGIVLGAALKHALGDKKQITRYASVRIPMDETLISADIDISNRAFLVYNLSTNRQYLNDFDTSLALEFWRAFVNNACINLHINQIYGDNAHHVLEASFKAVAIALKHAVSLDNRLGCDSIPSTKGLL